MAGKLKNTYHHGDLRQALIDASRQLVHDRGEADFSLADACRQAGVTTAAPYRHFADKLEILAEVIAQGFAEMSLRGQTAANAFPRGGSERITALGNNYLGFAIEEPALFRLMFGQKPEVSQSAMVVQSGQSCFGYVLREVVDYCDLNDIPGDAQLIAVQLWTMVHGAATLTIDGDYTKIVPDLDVQRMLVVAADRLLHSLLPPKD